VFEIENCEVHRVSPASTYVETLGTHSYAGWLQMDSPAQPIDPDHRFSSSEGAQLSKRRKGSTPRSGRYEWLKWVGRGWCLTPSKPPSGVVTVESSRRLTTLGRCNLRRPPVPASSPVDPRSHAQHGFLQRCQILPAVIPEDRWIRIVVLVSKNVTDTSDCSPRNVCFLFLELIGQSMAGFGQNLEISLNKLPGTPV